MNEGDGNDCDDYVRRGRGVKQMLGNDDATAANSRITRMLIANTMGGRVMVDSGGNEDEGVPTRNEFSDKGD